MNNHTIELNGKEVQFRLTSSDCLAIEKKFNISILEYVKQINMTTIINLLMYMRRPFEGNVSQDSSAKLYDELIDAGYTMEKIVFDIIYETLVVSGFLTKSQLEEAKIETETLQEEKKAQIKKEIIAE